MKSFLTILALLVGVVVTSLIKMDTSDEKISKSLEEAVGIPRSGLSVSDSPISEDYPAYNFNQIAQRGPTTVSVCEGYGGYPHSDFTTIEVRQQLTQGTFIALNQDNEKLYLAVGFSARDIPDTLLNSLLEAFIAPSTYIQYLCLYPIQKPPITFLPAFTDGRIAEELREFAKGIVDAMGGALYKCPRHLYTGLASEEPRLPLSSITCGYLKTKMPIKTLKQRANKVATDFVGNVDKSAPWQSVNSPEAKVFAKGWRLPTSGTVDLYYYPESDAFVILTLDLTSNY